MKRQQHILVTGGAGFIGSNFIAYLLNSLKEIRIINLDKLTYAGDLKNLEPASGNSRYTFVEGDICDQKLVADIFEAHDVNNVIHFAAESHVDNSIASPSSFIDTNITGTFILLETAREQWSHDQESMTYNRFHHISTDEVYGSLGAEGYFTEASPYAPNSPYSASKAAADFLVRSYGKTYGLNVVTSNCSNNYGPKQHDEKLIPTIIRKALAGEAIPIYGNGTNIRDWLYVGDHCKALELVFSNGREGETYAIGGVDEMNNLEIAQTICEILDRKTGRSAGSLAGLIEFVRDRPGHDYRYAIDSSKIKENLGWKPQISLQEGLEKTIDWYMEKYQKG